MKPRLLIPATLLLTLTACTTIRTPRNDLSELIMQSEFQDVATQHPKFASYLIHKTLQSEHELASMKARVFELMKEKRKRTASPATPLPH